MRLKFIVCKTIQREAYYCASQSPNVVDIVLMPHGLHCDPDELRNNLQTEVNQVVDVQDRPYDAVLLGYGLCSNGIAGVRATEIPIVVARAHDCITLLLGSKELYRSYFDSHHGIYWYSVGWIESTLMPGKERYQKMLNEYNEKYGKDNGEYLMKMEQNWLKEYSWGTFVDWELPNSDEHKQYAKESADYLKWNYDELKGDKALLQNLVDGKWTDDSYLVVNPGQEIAADVAKPGIIKVVPSSS